MSYIGFGTPVTEQSYEVRTQVFSGNGSNDTFTLNYFVNKNEDLEVLVNNVQQSPFGGSYTAYGTSLVFSTPPSVGSNNVYVIYRTFYQVSPILNNQAVQTSFIADTAVTSAKLANGAVVTGKVADTISLGNVTHSGTTTLLGPATTSNTISLNSRARSANHATQKAYVDALTIIFGA